jgi:hypothetical protein
LGRKRINTRRERKYRSAEHAMDATAEPARPVARATI